MDRTVVLVAVVVLSILLALWAFTAVMAWRVARETPPQGGVRTIDGVDLHAIHEPAPSGADLPPIVFIHGASGNALDLAIPLRPAFSGRAELLFVDRPGHGWSGRDPARHATPYGQADAIAALMEAEGIRRAVVVGHSFGGAVAAAFALRHPEKTAGLVFLAAASHPWPGAGTNWYYKLTVRPLLGALFARIAALPAGLFLMDRTTHCVFSPNLRPDDYVARAGIRLVLRPAAFRANAIDVEGLYAHVAEASTRYGSIAAPTVVVTGDRDTVVFEEIHSIGLARDIPGAAYVEVRNLGHKPDWIAPDLVVAAVEKAAGRAVDLDAVKGDVEARIAADRYGPAERCPDLPPPPG